MTKEELDIQIEIEKYFTESTGFGRDKIKNFMDIVNKALKQKEERIKALENKIAELNMKIDGLEEQNSYMFNEIALQEQQIEKMKMCCNCRKWRECGEQLDHISYPCHQHDCDDVCPIWELWERR